MKKILIIFVMASFVFSCGPKRLGCGPGRCENSIKEKPLERKDLKNIV